MAPPSEIKTTANVARSEKATPADVAQEDIIAAVRAWIRKPDDRAFWVRLVSLSETDATVTMEVSGDGKYMSAYSAVSKELWAHYLQLPYRERAALLVSLVGQMGPVAPRLMREMIITALAKEPAEVSGAISEALDAIPEEEIHSGAKDRELVRLATEASIARREEECAEKGAPKNCGDTLYPLYAKYRHHSGLRAPMLGVGLRAFDGSKMKSFASGLALGFDSMGPHGGEATRPFYGGALVYGGDVFSLSARAGVNFTREGATSGRALIEAGYLRLRGPETDARDVPIKPVRREGDGYLMQSVDVDRVFTGAQFMLGAELDQAIYQTWTGGGGSFSLNLVLGIGGGLGIGSTRDDGCYYSYSLGETAGVMPNGGGAVVSPEASLGSRCRGGEFTLGTLLAGSVGLRSEF